MGYKVRMREIPFSKVEDIKIKMNMKWNEIADLLGIGTGQLCMYRRCGKVPASRYYAVKDALLAQHVAKYKDDINTIEELFN